MSPKSFLLTDALGDYLLAHSSGLDDVARDLMATTAALGPIAGMQLAPEQALLLTALTRLGNVRHAIEVGTFTGFSGLAIARGLAPGGRLLCCDVSEEWTAIAREHWERAGVADRIDLRIAPAAETLGALPADTVVDLAFIDADKGGYLTYYEALVPLLRPGGVLLADNTLWSGRVLDDRAGEPDDVALRAFNDHVVADPRVDVVLLPLGDGLTLAQKRTDPRPG